MIFILICAIAPFVYTRGIHKHMTDDEIMQVFQTTPDKVPDYEVVPVKHTFHERADNYIVETAFQNEKITFNLKQTESSLVGQHTKVWTANKNSDNEHGIEYKLIENAFEDIGRFYEDPEYLAAFALTKEDEDGMNELGNIFLLDGVFTINGNNMVLRSLPKSHRLKRDIQQLNSLSSAEDNNHMKTTVDHVVFQMRESPNLSETSRPANSFVQKLDKLEMTKISKRSVPNTIYPEMLIIVDYNYYLYFEQNFAKALSYIVTFFNGVDLRFRALSEPEVRLNIAGIILCEDEFPFFKSFHPDKNNALHASRTLDEVGNYLYKEKRIAFKKDYDLALLMTGYDLFPEEGNMILGIAFASSACKQTLGGQQIWAVGLVHDKFDFLGILIAAHELGHLFGADHDAEHCENGNIMSGTGHYASMKHLFQFSNCNQKEMRNFFASDDAECLFNKPPEDEPVPVILPGQYMSLHEQCVRRGFEEAINDDETVCTNLCCSPQTENDGCLLPAVQGSPCGFDMHCWDGRCEHKSTEKYFLTTSKA